VAAIAAALFIPATAAADITGTVTTPRGAPIVGESVSIRDANDGFVDFQTTDSTGRWTTKSSDLAGNPPPFTAKVSTFDGCDESGNSGRDGSASIPGDGASGDMQIDLLEFCNGASFSGPEGTAFIDAPGHQIISAPGGTAVLRVLASSSGSNFTVSLPDGTVLGSSPDNPRAIPVTFPAPYSGPFNISYTASGGAPVSFAGGTLTVAAVGPPTPATGNVDLEAIVDISGSMGGTDPKYRRKDAVNLLLDLAKKGDKLGAVGFDDGPQPIFNLTTISGQSVINNLKNLANTQIINRGGTNYNVGFDDAYKALTASGVDQKRPKGAIFLTDGGHNSGPYNNGHLRFAINSSGHSWPVCVVQLGTSFQQADVDRLKRIAQETGGQYVATPTDDQLAGLYFSCLGLTTGQKTVVNKVFTFKKGQTKTVKRRLPKKKLPSVTFFFNHGGGNYDIKLRDPRGKIHTPKRPGRGASFGKGATYAFYRIRRPDGGVWRMIVKALQLPATTDRGNVKITITPGK
jgi:hypothetical protein